MGVPPGVVVGAEVGVGVGVGVGVAVAVGAMLAVALGEGRGGTVGDVPAGAQEMMNRTRAIAASFFMTR
jgi:hypothetical protein